MQANKATKRLKDQWHGPGPGVAILESKLKIIHVNFFHRALLFFNYHKRMYNLHRLLYSIQQKHMKNEQTNKHTIVNHGLTMGGQTAEYITI